MTTGRGDRSGEASAPTPSRAVSALSKPRADANLRVFRAGLQVLLRIRSDRPPVPGTRKSNDATAATLGYETQLWQMADAQRGSMDAAEYKHVVLGLPFLKYISDAFEE